MTSSYSPSIFFSQVVFLSTGVLSTCLAQFVFYMGAGDQRVMLLPLCNYLGMMLVGLVPNDFVKRSKKNSFSISNIKQQDKDKQEYLPHVLSTSPFARSQSRSISRRQHSDTESDAELISFHSEDHYSNSPEYTSSRKSIPPLIKKQPIEHFSTRYSVQFCIYLNVLLDFAGCIFSNIGLSMVGSGIFQVIYSSIVCWSAILSQTLLKKEVSRDEWVGIGVVTFGLAFSALGDSGDGGKHHVMIIGSLNTLIGAGFYAGTYVVGEYTLKLPERPEPRDLCVKIGTVCVGVIAVYMTIFVLPNWHRLVTIPIAESGGQTSAIVIALTSYSLCQLAHGLSYFMMLDSSGAVTTGIMQSLRAVCVFGLSSVIYCSKQESQCFDTKRGVATLVVVSGVLFYSYSKQKSPNWKLKKERRHRKRSSVSVPIKNCIV